MTKQIKKNTDIYNEGIKYEIPLIYMHNIIHYFIYSHYGRIRE